MAAGASAAPEAQFGLRQETFNEGLLGFILRDCVCHDFSSFIKANYTLLLGILYKLEVN